MLVFDKLKAHARQSKMLLGFLLLANLPVASTAFAAPAGEQVATAASAQASDHPKTIVFIHGMFMTPKGWDNWQAYFQKLGYTTIAPPWPLHDTSIEQQRSPQAQDALGKLTLDEVIESYRKVLRQLPEKPIVIGHSMGGLIAQKLLAEGLAAEAVAIDSAPPSGLIVMKWSFIRSNWPVVNPFSNVDKPYSPTLDDFRYSFANCVPDAESEAIFNEYGVPESRRVGRGTSADVAKIDFSKSHGPLLIVAGEDDHIIPAALNRKNFEKYTDKSSVTDFHQFAGQCHVLIVDQHWKDVADYVADWLGKH